jgi:hypothetical protein
MKRINVIRETTVDQLPYSMGGPWVDKEVPVGSSAKEYDDLDRELTDEEIEESMGWKPAVVTTAGVETSRGL